MWKAECQILFWPCFSVLIVEFAEDLLPRVSIFPLVLLAINRYSIGIVTLIAGRVNSETKKFTEYNYVTVKHPPN